MSARFQGLKQLADIQGENMSQRLLWLLPLIALLCGCDTRQNMRDTAQLPSATGVLVTTVRVRSVDGIPYPPVSLAYNVMRGMGSTKVIPLVEPNNTVVLEMPAGDYYWTGVRVGNAASPLTLGVPFTIEAGKINYIGDVWLVLDDVHRRKVKGELKPTYGIYTRDQHAYTLPKAASAYPELWHAYPVVTHLAEDPLRKLL